MAEQLCKTPGGIAYRLSDRRVKNINLRVRRDGTVAVSAPGWASRARVDAFVDGHAAWLAAAQARAAESRQKNAAPLPDRAEALAHFTALSDAVFPKFCQALGGQKPAVQVRDMTSRWGVCHISKRRLTFALRLYQQPPEAQLYVVVHEYCHFLVPNHSAAFWRQVEAILPDWKQRRALLR